MTWPEDPTWIQEARERERPGPRRKLIEGRAYCGWCNASEHGLTVGVYACYCDGPCNVPDCPELLKVPAPEVPRFK